jgi:cellulose synthase/poly-beta-1,6-N-acetylglucosamine synthase-like glycosyltransferase
MNFLDWFFGFVYGYYLALHGTYLVLIVIGLTQMRRYQQGIVFGDFKRIAESQLTMPISVIIPAYNEEKVIVNSVLGALNLTYPQHEVVVVSDGSTDATIELLIRRFSLREVHKVGPRRFKTQEVRAVYESPEFPKLVVVDKANGQRADAINAGVNLSRYPLLCVMDADCVFETDALVRSVRPFLRDRNVVAAGGIVRPANGLTVTEGRITGRGLPRGYLALYQTVEYLRAFQWARLGLARLGSMLCISGAFTVVKKDLLIAMGGFNPNAITDDIEFTVRLHEYLYRERRGENLRIAYIPDPVCYTEVPETIRVHRAQRNRWQRGTLQTLLRHIHMTFNPRYGMAGMFGMPFFLFFEAFSAMVEITCYVMAPVLYLAGYASVGQLLLFLTLAILLGTFLSVSAVLLQENTRLRTTTTRELLRLLGAGFTENLGYHQMHLLWRVAGTFDYLVRNRTDLGLMERYGTYQAPAPAPALETR